MGGAGAGEEVCREEGGREKERCEERRGSEGGREKRERSRHIKPILPFRLPGKEMGRKESFRRTFFSLLLLLVCCCHGVADLGSAERERKRDKIGADGWIDGARVLAIGGLKGQQRKEETEWSIGGWHHRISLGAHHVILIPPLYKVIFFNFSTLLFFSWERQSDGVNVFVGFRGQGESGAESSLKYVIGSLSSRC